MSDKSTKEIERILVEKEIERILAPAIDPRAPYTKYMIAEISRLLTEARGPSEITDEHRVDFLEEWARRSPTGISVDHVVGEPDEPGGFRFMRRHYIGPTHANLRAALDVEIRRERGLEHVKK